jgi:hypothetical protein
MRLSEAIMMNGMTKPQGFGVDSMYSLDAPCAIGGALQAVGERQQYSVVGEVWPWTEENDHIICPLCKYPVPAEQTVAVLFHLNDIHKWTRAQIAEWVASIEPREGENVEVIEEVVYETV